MTTQAGTNGSRVLIDAANLHSGGGVQVAASFLDELAMLRNDADALATYPWLSDVRVEASPTVCANIAPETARDLGVVERARHAKSVDAWRESPTHDVAFTVFGSAYGRRRGRYQISGFADGTSIYDVPELASVGNAKTRAASAVRRALSRLTFSRADELVVEAPHVREQLERAWKYPATRVHVVPNTVNGVFTQGEPAPSSPKASCGPQAQRDGSDGNSSPTKSGWLYVTRSYPHKNLEFLGEVGEALHAHGVDDVIFTLTLREDEWNALSQKTRKHCRTVGSVTVDALPSLYRGAEGSVFPSLLESFSAAPLEAIHCDLPLVASDRQFVRDVCGDAAVYADPSDADAWARAIIALRTDSELQGRLAAARAQVVERSTTPRQRAAEYVRIIDEALKTSALNRNAG